MSKIENKQKLFGGLNAKNFDKINHEFFCELCEMLLLKPYQLLCCGILLCQWCLQNGLSNSEPFTCQFCHLKQEKKEAMPDRGADRELKKIIVVCYLCPWTGIYKDYLDHLQDKHADFECVDCHELFFAINTFEEHRQKLCVHRSIPCGLHDCSNSIKWYDMKAHYISDGHQNVLLTFISQHTIANSKQAKIQKRSEATAKEYIDILESIDIALSAIETLLVDFARLIAEISQIKTNLEQNGLKIEEVKKQEIENEKNIKELSQIQNTTQIELENIKEMSEQSKILILDANATTIIRVNYPNMSSTSPKFRTSQYGYTFTTRACQTNESGQEYLSIYLTLCNGEYSNLIPYPFLYNIHLTLCDQSNQQNHIEYIVKPDQNSPAFNRPTSDKNDEYGITKFCLMEHLTNPESKYIKDQAFFIRIFVDFLNTGQDLFQSKGNIKNSDNLYTTAMVTEQI